MTEKTNGIDAELASKYIAMDDESTSELLALQMSYMGDCAVVREAQKRRFKSAVAEGMPADAWRTYLKEHRIKAKAAKQIENLYADEDGDDVRETAGMIRDALGADYASLPLGAFSVARGAPEEDDAPLKSKPRRGRPPKAQPDMSAKSKADALAIGEDEPDLRGKRQKEREAAREAEVRQQLSGIKPLDIPPSTH